MAKVLRQVTMELSVPDDRFYISPANGHHLANCYLCGGSGMLKNKACQVCNHDDNFSAGGFPGLVSDVRAKRLFGEYLPKNPKLDPEERRRQSLAIFHFLDTFPEVPIDGSDFKEITPTDIEEACMEAAASG